MHLKGTHHQSKLPRDLPPAGHLQFQIVFLVRTYSLIKTCISFWTHTPMRVRIPFRTYIYFQGKHSLQSIYLFPGQALPSKHTLPSWHSLSLGPTLRTRRCTYFAGNINEQKKLTKNRKWLLGHRMDSRCCFHLSPRQSYSGENRLGEMGWAVYRGPGWPTSQAASLQGFRGQHWLRTIANKW